MWIRIVAIIYFFLIFGIAGYWDYQDALRMDQTDVSTELKPTLLEELIR